MENEKQRKNPYPLGAHKEGEEIRFSFVSKTGSCGILLFDRKTGRRIKKLPFLPEERIGNIYCKRVSGIKPENILYQFYEGERIVADEYARVFVGKAAYGKTRAQSDLKAGFLTEAFQWGEDKCPRIPYSEAVCYCLHVRGFTRHVSSEVKDRGTFAGIAEKIPYLREIGVTTVELQPAYEFLEAEEPQTHEKPWTPFEGEAEKRLNYWGYKKGFYYAPKAAYAGSEPPSFAFKTLIKRLHENGMELVMQLYFPRETDVSGIADILRFWVLEYHVDGFRLLGENIEADLLAGDPMLADTKLWYNQFSEDILRVRGETSGQVSAYPHRAEYNDGWLYDMRRFLKGDEGMLDRVLYQMRHIPEGDGRIHYLTNYNGFTLADMVSYDEKHNEANGEDNRDGCDYNCSWNCGEEGTTRKNKIRRLRIRQMKNAMCFLMLSQSTPLIFMGDEFGNSQRGNNNPYCQDNATAWLDWRDIGKNEELFSFFKMLTEFRREHPILHPDREFRLMDYIACGYPDLSYHGQSAWKPQTEGRFRHIGLMYCGKYAKIDRNREDDFLYVALNMHWIEHELALPKLPKGMSWELAFSTAEESVKNGVGDGGAGENAELLRRIPPRSVSVYCGKAFSESAQIKER